MARLKSPVTMLRDILPISSNSNAAEIQKSYKEKEIQGYKDATEKLVYTSSGKTVASIQTRGRTLLNLIRRSSTDLSKLKRLEELISHMNKYPVTRSLLRRDGGISVLLGIREETNDANLKNKAKIALSILGWSDPVRGSGIRVLSIDGGGTRGIIAIEILKKLEALCDQKISEMFDLVVGTSTGAMLAFLLAFKDGSLHETDHLYKRLSSEIFQTNAVMGAGKLFFKHAFYDTEVLVKILKSEVGESEFLYNTAASSKIPKVAAVSTLVNHVVLQPYIFRNYSLPSEPHELVKTAYLGSSKHRLWEALQASCAAPGYFEECRLGEDIHQMSLIETQFIDIDDITLQDGGLLTNNPCALAIHESKLLWPNTPLQTVVSVGTGLYHGRSGPHTSSFTSLRAKLLKLVASATDVEAVHVTLQDLLPPSTYFRFNPNMSIDVPLDESGAGVLEQLQTDAKNYVDKYEWKFIRAADSLKRQKTVYETAKDSLNLRLAMRK
eukprot:gene6140-6846_t